MRLLNTETLKLESFVPSFAPPYAILSHTWGDEEVILQDMETMAPELLQRKKGFAKIRDACKHARENGQNYIWIDTCCIDKTSSAELSETIVSMFKWYQKSVVCYVFLMDFDDGVDCSAIGKKMKACRWFKRGWTLQELIAPEKLIFVNAEWKVIGTKASLKGLLEDITGISATILTGEKPLSRVGVDERIGWVVKSRETTWEEDMAYCLVGLLDISMPAIYGEGRERAFKRLRRELQSEGEQVQATPAPRIPELPKRERREAPPIWDDVDQSFLTSELDLDLRSRGYEDNPSNWANLGDGALEVEDDIEGCFMRPLSINISYEGRQQGPPAGMWYLRRAVTNLYNKHHRDYTRGERQFTWENVCIVPGQRAAFQRIASALGHGALGIFVPDIYAPHNVQSLFRRFQISPIPVYEENPYRMAARFKEEIERGTTALLASISGPVPSLSINNHYELAEIQDICRERATLIIDETLSGFNYASDCDGTTASAAENIIDVESDDVLIIDGLATRFRLPSWHVSWIIGSKKHIKAIAAHGSYLDDGTSTVFQENCVAMLDPLVVRKDTRALQEHFRAKRDYAIKRLREMGFLIAHIPTCAFYVWLNVENMPESINSGLKFYHACIQERVIVTPGVIFDSSLGRRRKPEDSPCYRQVRLSFGPSMEVLKMGLDRIELVCRKG